MRSLFTLLFLFNVFSSVAQIRFLPYKAISLGSRVEAVVIGDINNDGLNDIIAGTTTYNNPANDKHIFVFTQNLQGDLNAPLKYPTGNYALSSIAVADINNDYLNDIVIGVYDSIGVFLQESNGTLKPMRSYYSGQNVNGTECGDLNNDGMTDIVVSHWNSNFIRVFYQSATGFSSSTYPKPIAGYDEIDIGDINGDGLKDVVFMAGLGIGGIHAFI